MFRQHFGVTNRLLARLQGREQGGEKGGGVNRFTGRWASGYALAAALLASGSAHAADPARGPAAVSEERRLPDEELDEALIEGRNKPVRDAQKVIDWLARLVGQFTFEGQVDLQGKSNPEDRRDVQGSGVCIGFGPAPAVHCELKVRWPEARGAAGEEIPGGTSNLDPAMLLFGFEPDRIGIRYMLVDSKGIAEGAMGLLITGDTLESRAPCVNIPAPCQRTTRITARPDLQTIRMQIDIERDGVKALGYSFVMQRLPGNNAVVIKGAQ